MDEKNFSIKDLLEKYQFQYQNSDEDVFDQYYFPTGLPSIDQEIKGFKKGSMSIIGGRLIIPQKMGQ